ncbi:hypothetical protein VCRA2122O12_150010 [Vibrio crassostreae]|nr:hypothetical protein VCRA2110O4_150087 [Vibrio crassostreae]CAK2575910.1 hypothetical protein VCRA2110O3_160011 [Vibrio crassostreae]CAK2594030.1 hypothetical protein VCRA2110O2_160087 [Vibrio crassostreae]CAK2633406.1 hypothetical protein VCRA2122O10_140087 [Vibrio crassostreae]CAK3205120.1 hypothetical protein VCRA2122O12_150010 [Vibrio crassostreae]
MIHSLYNMLSYLIIILNVDHIYTFLSCIYKTIALYLNFGSS